jgi:hypothetical protein
MQHVGAKRRRAFQIGPILKAQGSMFSPKKGKTACKTRWEKSGKIIANPQRLVSYILIGPNILGCSP